MKAELLIGIWFTGNCLFVYLMSATANSLLNRNVLNYDNDIRLIEATIVCTSFIAFVVSGLVLGQ